jgi:hypothetical protein
MRDDIARLWETEAFGVQRPTQPTHTEHKPILDSVVVSKLASQHEGPVFDSRDGLLSSI